jgi:hypothetical protein
MRNEKLTRWSYRTKGRVTCAAVPGAMLIAATCFGCITSIDYITTDEKLIRNGNIESPSDILAGDVALDAVRASAAHDLQCPRDRVVPQLIGPREYLADGCGQRATYKALVDLSPGQRVVRHVLTGRFSLEPARPVNP